MRRFLYALLAVTLLPGVLHAQGGLPTTALWRSLSFIEASATKFCPSVRKRSGHTLWTARIGKGKKPGQAGLIFPIPGDDPRYLIFTLIVRPNDGRYSNGCKGAKYILEVKTLGDVVHAEFEGCPGDDPKMLQEFSMDGEGVARQGGQYREAWKRRLNKDLRDLVLAAGPCRTADEVR